ncbi:MAG: hypothetical protein RIS70_3382 [Planctomycetota bacterium]
MRAIVEESPQRWIGYGTSGDAFHVRRFGADYGGSASR